MTEFSDEEALRYWKAHDRYWRDLDRTEDEWALTNVGYAGAPLWLNRAQDRIQRRVFRRLTASIGPPQPGRRALDIGCGGGRWCVELARLGYVVTGLDLQEHLLERNRAQFPGIEFVCQSIENFGGGPFDLITSVTVLQHVAPDRQTASIAHLRGLLAKGGYLIALENTRDHGTHVFSSTVEQWSSKFLACGFVVEEVVKYDFRPTGRLVDALAGRVRGALRAEVHSASSPEEQVRLYGSRRSRSAFREAHRLATVHIDGILEPALARMQAGSSTHAGFVLRADD